MAEKLYHVLLAVHDGERRYEPGDTVMLDIDDDDPLFADGVIEPAEGDPDPAPSSASKGGDTNNGKSRRPSSGGPDGKARRGNPPLSGEPDGKSRRGNPPSSGGPDGKSRRGNPPSSGEPDGKSRRGNPPSSGEPDGNKDADATAADRAARLIAAIAGLGEDNAAHWTSSGKPRTEALEAISGLEDVGAAERDAAFAAYREAQAGQDDDGGKTADDGTAGQETGGVGGPDSESPRGDPPSSGGPDGD